MNKRIQPTGLSKCLSSYSRKSRAAGKKKEIVDPYTLPELHAVEAKAAVFGPPGTRSRIPRRIEGERRTICRTPTPA
jgi:hypothetical protein